MDFLQNKQVFRAVGNRCAIIFEELGLPQYVGREQAFFVLQAKGFKKLEVDLMVLAGNTLGSAYRRSARLHEAPEIFDCSSLMKWLYGQLGVEIPRRAIQQRDFGRLISASEIRPGDLIFSKGRIPYYVNNPENGVGHVGMITDKRTVIHAANKQLGVTEIALEGFADENNLRGYRRIVSDLSRLTVLEAPPEREVETSDDIRWIIIQNLPEIKKAPVFA